MTTGRFFEDLEVGQTASLGKTITEADILLYAAVCTDTNPIHIDAEAAKQSIFGERIAHGMLTRRADQCGPRHAPAGPGIALHAPVAALRRPVKIGDTVKATATVTALNPEKKRATLKHGMHGRRHGGDRGRGLRPGPVARADADLPRLARAAADARGATVALGNFDGVHRGHAR